MLINMILIYLLLVIFALFWHFVYVDAIMAFIMNRFVSQKKKNGLNCCRAHGLSTHRLIYTWQRAHERKTDR